VLAQTGFAGGVYTFRRARDKIGRVTAWRGRIARVSWWIWRSRRSRDWSRRAGFPEGTPVKAGPANAWGSWAPSGSQLC